MRDEVDKYFEEWWTPKELPRQGFNKTAMLDFAESYAREYHQKEMERKLEEAFKNWVDNEDPFRTEWFNNGVAWALNHLKEQKQDKV